MAVRNIVLYPNTVLAKTAAPVESFGPNITRLAADMFETMQAYDGCGLAAPQIGVLKRLFVLHEPEKNLKLCLVNPEIIEGEAEETAEEGCLSLPRIYAPVTRRGKIRVRAQNERGKPITLEASGLLARIIQHETDHLNGVMLLDRLDVLTRADKMQEWNEIREQLTLEPAGPRALAEGANRSC
jgi:peptide deformylase